MSRLRSGVRWGSDPSPSRGPLEGQELGRESLSQPLYRLKAPLHISVCDNRLQFLLYGQQMVFVGKINECDCASSHRNDRILRLMKPFGFVQNNNPRCVPFYSDSKFTLGPTTECGCFYELYIKTIRLCLITWVFSGQW